MKKFFTMIAAFLLAFMLVFCFTACETEVSVTVGDDGYLIINGEKTDMKRRPKRRNTKNSRKLIPTTREAKSNGAKI